MRIHPLVAGAAVGVMALSAVGVAAITGYLPGSRAEKAPQVANTAEPVKAPQKQVAVAPAKPARTKCADCGVVVAVREVDVKGEGTGLGAVVGGVAGAVVGHEIGGGRDAGTLIGGVGGAVAGHQIERHARSSKRFDVDVRMTDGTVKTVSSETQPTWRNGDRVRVRNGKLVSQTG